MKKLFIILFMFSTMLFANIGTITLLEGEAVVIKNSNTVKLNLGDEIENKDIIETKVNSKVKITFIDNTIVTIGKESTLKVDDYYYTQNDKDNVKTELSIPKGAFHAITGQIGKVNPDKFKLKTKNATIGIRGTEFYGDDNRIVCTQGRIIVLSNGVSVDVPSGNYLNIFSNQRPSEVLPLENNTLEDIEERLNTNNQGNNGNNLDSFNNNPSSPLALDGTQSNNQENIDNQNSWGDWNTNILALNNEKSNAKMEEIIQNKINHTEIDPNPIDPNPIDPNPIDPNPIDPNSILTDSTYVQGLMDDINDPILSFSGTIIGLNDSGNINFNLYFGGGSASVNGNFNFLGYEAMFEDEITTNGFNNISAWGIGQNGDISANINGSFYGAELNKVVGDINIEDMGTIIPTTFSATR
ncbi:FecR domain-containing protein [Aliarcobacter vitoriensis]|uniref:FecR family protein n=1 Tax=Aliarcobacter vitoriensis TaxID=2011099 RepID=UPI003AAFBD3A